MAVQGLDNHPQTLPDHPPGGPEAESPLHCLQALSNVPPLRNYFLEEENYRRIQRPPGDIMFLLVQRFGELMRKLWNPRNFKAHVSPHEMLQAVVLCSKKNFQITKQGGVWGHRAGFEGRSWTWIWGCRAGFGRQHCVWGLRIQGAEQDPGSAPALLFQGMGWSSCPGS